MANRYWVYNGGNINDTTHWSATSGGAGGASKPTLADNVIFDANSFTLNAQVVTLNEAFNCLSMDWTGISKTVTFSSSVFILNLYGNLTLATNLTWLFTGTAYLNHKATGTVTTNGVILNANRVYFDAAGITVTNADAANYGVASFYLTNGTWNTNGKTITSTGSFNTVTGTKVLTLGATIFNIGTWTNAVPAGFTFNYNTSTVVITTASILTGITTFYNLTCSGVATLTLANNITVTNALTLAGSSVSNRLKILSSIAGTQRTVTVPAAGVFPSNLDVQDMAFPNAVDMSAISGYSQDFGNNTGITFTTSANLFFKHTSGAANWGDITKWFLADRSTQGRIPLIQDDVNFDNLSFTGTSTLTLNILATCRSMNWTGLNQAVTLSSAVNSLSIYGDTTLATGLIWTFNGTAYVYMKAPDACNITTNGVVPVFNKLYFDRIGGSWTNQDDFNVGSSYIGLANGTWNTNGKAITTTNCILPLVGVKTLILNSSIFKCREFGEWRGLDNVSFVVNAGTSTIICDRFISYSQVYNNVITASGKLAGGHIFNELSLIASAAGCYLDSKNTITVTKLTLDGSYRRVKLASFESQKINVSASIVVAKYADFWGITGLGAANWDLSAISGGSGDCGDNTNIIFTIVKNVFYRYTLGNCAWKSANWYLDYAGTINSNQPLVQDSAIFDANSFTGAATLTIDSDVISSLDMQNLNQPVTIKLINLIECNRSLILSNLVSITGNYAIILKTSVDSVINTFNKTIYALGFVTVRNTMLVQSDLTITNSLSQGLLYNTIQGILDFNDFSVVCATFIISSQFGAPTIYLRSGIFTITGTVPITGKYLGGIVYVGDYFAYGQFDLTAGVVFYCGTSTIKLLGVAANNGGFNGAGKTYNKVWFSGMHTGSFDILGSITIAELTIDAGRKVRFTAASTTTIGKLTAIGTQANPVTIGSITAASHNLIKTGADMVEVEYCNISNSNATPSDKWAGGDTSVDGGGNSGWTFKFIPIIMWFFGIFSKK